MCAIGGRPWLHPCRTSYFACENCHKNHGGYRFKDPSVDIGVNDCSKVHHALLPRLEAILGTEDTYMELTSPGMERNFKNAAEFSVFKGREVRVWDKTVTDWVGGKIVSADEKSVTLEKDGENQTISFENIAKAKFIHL